MIKIKEYIFLLLGVIVISGIVSMLAPETSLKKYVSLLIGICILSATIAPISELLGYMKNAELGIVTESPQKEDYESVFKNTLTDGNERAFCDLLKSKMVRELDIDAESFDVHADMYISDGEYKLESLAVILYGKEIMKDPEGLRSYTRSLLGIECEIIYG